MSPASGQSVTRRALRLAGRALRLRCVACGARPIFVTWFRMLPSCPTCGFAFERGERGYWLGAYFVNVMLMETVFCVWLVGVIVGTWPQLDWDLMQHGVTALMIVAPFAGFPFSKTLFVAFDLLVRPPVEDDFDAPTEPAARVRREG